MRQLSTRRLFLSICGCSTVLVLVFYLYGTKLLEKPAAVSSFFTNRLSRTKLQNELFKNVTNRIRLPDICSTSKSTSSHFTATSLVFVLSEPQNSRRRQIIRTSWAQKKVNFLLGSAVAFVVPVSGIESRSYRTQLRLESEVFDDVLLNNLSLTNGNNDLPIGTPMAKTVPSLIDAMRWASKNCKKVDFVVVLPDETFLNPFALERFLADIILHDKQSAGTSRQLVGTSNSAANLLDVSEIDRESDEQQHSRDLKRFKESSPRIGSTGTTIQEPIRAVETSSHFPYNHHHRVIYCLVWRNITVEQSSWNSDWIPEQNPNQQLESYRNPSYCSPHGFVLSLNTSRALIEAASKKNDGIEMIDTSWPSEFYVTGVLAARGRLSHENVKNRYAFDLGEIDDGTVFVPLGVDADTLTASLWKMTVDNEQDAGTFNSAVE